MAEDAQTSEVIQTTGEQEPHGTEETRDWKAEYDRLLADTRKWERRAKDNAQKAKEYDALQQQSTADAERADAATKRAEEAEAKVAEYERRAERDALVAEVAEGAGVDAGLLSRMSGDTREEIEANARLLSERIGAMRLYPSVSDSGQQSVPKTTGKDISAIRDPGERVMARAREIARNRR